MNPMLFECVWCCQPAAAHGPPGESPLGDAADRLCPTPGVTSQFFSPRIDVHLRGVRASLQKAHKAIGAAIDTLDKVLEP